MCDIATQQNRCFQHSREFRLEMYFCDEGIRKWREGTGQGKAIEVLYAFNANFSCQEAFSLGTASARTLILDFILELWTAGWMSVEALYGQSANSLLRTDTSKYKHTT